jgi:NTE family protein
VDALVSATTDNAVLHSGPPFRSRDPKGVRLREHLAAIVDGSFTIDLTRKQIAGERAVWTLRLRDRPDAFGQVEVGFRDGRVAELRLGPAAPPR